MSKVSSKNKTLLLEEKAALIRSLESRFHKNLKRHSDVAWSDVRMRLEANPDKLWSLNEMENSGGEPDVVSVDEKTGEIIFFDCSPETPKGRVSLCYDREGLESRKEHKPRSSAMDEAAAMGIEMLTEADYRNLQALGEFDLKTSSWIQTPPEIRKLGGALFCDRRYGQVFTYHNGAQSYYGVRGFRGKLKV